MICGRITFCNMKDGAGVSTWQLIITLHLPRMVPSLSTTNQCRVAVCQPGEGDVFPKNSGPGHIRRALDSTLINPIPENLLHINSVRDGYDVSDVRMSYDYGIHSQRVTSEV